MWVPWWTRRNIGRFISGFLPFSPTTYFIPLFLQIRFISSHQLLWWCNRRGRTASLLFKVLQYTAFIACHSSTWLCVGHELKRLYSTNPRWFNIHHQRVLPKGRSFTASAGTNAEFLLRAGIPPQTQEPRLQFYQGWMDAVASRYFPHPTLSLTSEQTVKDLKRSQGHQRGGEKSGFG